VVEKGTPVSASAAILTKWACAPRQWLSCCSRTATCRRRIVWGQRESEPGYSTIRWNGNGAVSWPAIGCDGASVEVCIRYARERLQFGQPIGQFQSVANRIADMKVRIETTRLILYKVAWLKKMGKPATMELLWQNCT
jgi:hypothetical protein